MYIVSVSQPWDIHERRGDGDFFGEDISDAFAGSKETSIEDVIDLYLMILRKPRLVRE